MLHSDVIFDAERMKYPFSGLNTYCAALANSLNNIETPNKLSIQYYVPKKAMRFLGNKASYIIQNSLHKFYNPYNKHCRIWHCTFQGTSYFPFGSSCKIVLTIHDLNFLHENISPAKVAKNKKALQLKIDASDAITTISYFVKKEIEENFSLHNKTIQVIYNGCNIPEHITTTQPSLPTNEPFLFSIGMIHHKKNFHVLPRLLLNNKYHLIIAGFCQDKSYQQKIVEEAKKLNVQDRVHIIGAVTESEKYWLYQNCEAFCFPSIAEGFGLPVVEAMYFGKPLILSTHTCLPEIGGNLARYFKTFDIEDMQTALTEALSDRTNLTLIEQLKFRALNFNWDELAKVYYQVYISLL